MGHPKEEESKCFICKKTITEKDMVDGKIEMIKGPDFKKNFKKVFVCVGHQGVNEEVKKENNGKIN
jgi:hypothetical protein